MRDYDKIRADLKIKHAKELAAIKRREWAVQAIVATCSVIGIILFMCN